MLSRAFDHIRMEKARYKFLIIIIILKRAARYNEFACKVIFALIILCWSEMDNHSKREVLKISKMNPEKCYYFIIFLKPSPNWLSKIFRNWKTGHETYHVTNPKNIFTFKY